MLVKTNCNHHIDCYKMFNYSIGYWISAIIWLTATVTCAYEVTPFTDQPFASLSYTAVVRGKAALPCHVTTSTPDDSVALILWYKDDALAPIYTLDARKGTLDQARTLTAPVLQGRAFFNLHNRPAFLKIDPVRLSDSGEYRCRVDFKKARTINTVISLKVIVPPEEPTISITDDINLKGLIGPYNEGDTLKLICTTIGGKPRPSLTWWRDNLLIDDTFEYTDKEVTTNQLTISSLSRHHLLSKLTCQAVNNNMTIPLATSITLELNLKPTEVHITQLSPILVSLKEATFECKTIGSRPKPNIYWLFDGKKHSTGVSGDQVVTSRITINVNKSHNGAMLSCISENPKILNSQITDQLQLDIQYKPQVRLEFGAPTSSSTVIQEGNDVYFDCKINSNPKPIKSVQWRFNGNQLSPKQGIIQSNQSLVLQKVSRQQNGLYQCIVTNSQGTGISNEINLEIRFAPVCLYSFILTYGLALHESAVLRCYVEANPEKVSFQWRFQDKSDPLSSSIQSKGKFSDLIYTVNSSDDYGIVYCIAKNDIGLQRSPCKFLIKPAVPPEFPYNCKIVNQSDDSLLISCIFIGKLITPTINNNNNAQFLGSNSLKNDDALTPSSLYSNLSSTTSSSSIITEITSSSSVMDTNISSSSSSSSGQQSNSITVHPRTIYFAEVYTKNDQILVSNVTNTNSGYYFSGKANVGSSSRSNELPLSSSTSSSINFLTSSPELGDTADPLEMIESFSRPIEFFITSLESSTLFSINIYAVNSFGRSDKITLEGSTLRSAEKLVDSFADIGLGDYGSTSGIGGGSSVGVNGLRVGGTTNEGLKKSSSSAASPFGLSVDDGVTLLRGIPLLLILLIGGIITVCGTVFLGIVAIFRLRRNILVNGDNSRGSGKVEGGKVANGGNGRGGDDNMSVTERISGSSIVQPELLTLTSQSSNATHHLNHLSSTNGLTTNNAIMFRDDDDDCYCDNTISESLLISGNVNHSHNNDHHHLSYHHHHHQSSLPNANHHHHPNSHLNQHNQRQSNVQLHRINESPNDNGTNNNNEGQLGGYDNFNSEKGPPDIIPSIGYQAGGGNGGEGGRGNMEKQFLAYGYSEDLDQSNGNNIVEYAELAFPGGGPLNAKLSSHQVIFPLPGGRLNQVTSSNNNINNLNNNNNNLNVTNNNNTTNQIVNHPERIEYAKIEFQKNSRVNIITSGSPKFESTV